MTHLTEDQIDELLMESLEPAEASRLRAHVAGCEACAAQLTGIEAPIASFKAVTAAWSERRSATLPVRPATRPATRWGLGFAWGSIAAAALLTAVIPVLRHEQNVRVKQAYARAMHLQGPSEQDLKASTQPAQPPTPSTSTADSTAVVVPENAQEIASDNRLLAMVDEELNAPLPSLRSATQRRGQSRTATHGSVQD
jgi:hypothetical protein